MSSHSFLHRLGAVALCPLASFLIAGPGSAQATSGPENDAGPGTSDSVLFGVMTGLGNGVMSVGGRGESASGLLLGGQVAFARDGTRTWVLEVTATTFEVPSPVLDESYRAVSLMLRRSFGSTISVAPGIGLDRRTWSGSERVEDSDTGITLGLNIGVPIRLSRRLQLLPEASAQTSGIELEGSVSALLLSVRMSLLVSPG